MNFSRYDINQRHWRRRGPLGQRLGVAAGVVVVADGPAVRRRRARYAGENVVVSGVSVGRGSDSPRGPVPSLDESLIGVAGIVVADDPAVGWRRARHGLEGIILCGAGV